MTHNYLIRNIPELKQGESIIINQNKSVFINKPKEFSFVGTVEEMEDWEVDCLYRARMMSDEIEASTSNLN